MSKIGKRTVAVTAALLVAACLLWYISALRAMARETLRVGKITGPFQLVIAVEHPFVKVGDTAGVRVSYKMRNVSSSPQYIYPDGLRVKVYYAVRKGLRERLLQWIATVWHRGNPHTNGMSPSFGFWFDAEELRRKNSPRGVFDRMAPGGSYSGSLRIPAVSAGTIRCRMQYSNDQTGKEQGLSAWTGSIEPLDSVDVRVSE